MTRALIIQHDPMGPAGIVADRFAHHGYELSTLHVLGPEPTEDPTPFPDPSEFDLVIPMGSPLSTYDREAVGAWIDGEVELLRRAVADNVAVFGICFGAQALCLALGGIVERAPAPEIGWIEIDTDDDAVVPAGPWFTWHDDRCRLPDAISPIARSPLAPQAFRHGSAMAVQFHPEAERPLVEGWLVNCPDEYLRERHIDPAALLDGFDRHGDTAVSDLHRMIDRFVDDVVV